MFVSITKKSGESVADQLEWRPIVGMRVTFAQLDHSGPQRVGFSGVALQTTIELSHKFGGTAIVNFPQRQEQRSGARVQQSAR